MHYECIAGWFDDDLNKHNFLKIKFNQENKINEFNENDKIEMSKIGIKI